VKIRLTDGREITGRVGSADGSPDGGVELLVSGQLRRIAYAEIERAVVEVEFKQPPAEELAMLGDPERDVEEESR
jgi:ribosome maturation factor RimP